MSAEFTAFYPQFTVFTPAVVLEGYIRQANSRFSSFAEEDAEEARRLYTAHKLTLYAQTYAEYNENLSPAAMMTKLAGSGVAAQALSKSVGGVSVSKSEGSALNSISGYGEWKQTEFGLQLIGLCKIAVAGGRYIP